jgi:hypothetical protein
MSRWALGGAVMFPRLADRALRKYRAKIEAENAGKSE